MGKTTLAHALAKTLGLDFQRIQFTSDLLPADILGVSMFDRDSSSFKFHPGPVFSQVILADEVNRATPKAQSALLEAMEEHQVTTDGQTRPLPEPFFVIATQNPSHQVGTFPLPESQLDRFLMRIQLGYPDAAAERTLLEGSERRDMISDLTPALATGGTASSLQKEVREVFTAPALLDYLQALIAHTRQSPDFVTGLQPARRPVPAQCRARLGVHGRTQRRPAGRRAGGAAQRRRPSTASGQRLCLAGQHPARGAADCGSRHSVTIGNVGRMNRRPRKEIAFQAGP